MVSARTWFRCSTLCRAAFSDRAIGRWLTWPYAWISCDDWRSMGRARSTAKPALVRLLISPSWVRWMAVILPESRGRRRPPRGGSGRPPLSDDHEVDVLPIDLELQLLMI